MSKLKENGFANFKKFDKEAIREKLDEMPVLLPFRTAAPNPLLSRDELLLVSPLRLSRSGLACMLWLSVSCLLL